MKGRIIHMRIKKYIYVCICLACTLFFSSTIYAEVINGKCSDSMVKWTFDSSIGTLTFKGSGKMGYWNIEHDAHYNSTHYTRNDVINIVVEEGVTSLKDLENTPNLRSLTVPKSVKKIEPFSCNPWTDNIIDVYITDVTAWNNIEHGCCYAYIPRYNLYLNNQKVTNLDKLWYDVKEIKPYAFAGCLSLTSIKIFEKMKFIGDHAFEGCSNIKSIVWGAKKCDSDEPFKDILEQITSFEFYDGVEEVPGNLCKGMKKIASINIPNSIQKIGYGAFEDCSGLKKVEISNLENWCNIIFESKNSNPLYHAHYLYLKGKQISKLEIPSTITKINDYAFIHNYGLVEVIIPNSILSIGDYAFADCYRMKSIVIPSSVQEIGDSAFEVVPNIIYSAGYSWNKYGARSRNGYIENSLVYSDKNKNQLLACFSDAKGDVVLPNTVERIGENAFYWCTNITSISIPQSVNNIEYGAFQGCTQLSSIILPNILQIRGATFYYCKGLQTINIPQSVVSIGDEAFYCCRSLRELVIPEAVNKIGEKAFYLCDSISSIKLPNSLSSIGTGAFTWCDKLKTVILPPNIKSIPGELFLHCTALQSITIPSNVSSIGSNAFKNCKSLTSLTFENALPNLKIAYNAFENCSSLRTFTIYDGIKIPKEIEEKIKVVRIPLEKPNVEVVPNSVTFYDPNQNGYMDVDEPCKIILKLHNNGQGEARNCVISVTNDEKSKFLHFISKLKPFNIPANEIKKVEIPIYTDSMATDGKVSVTMMFSEAQGQLIRPTTLTIPTKHFERPSIILSGYELFSYNEIAQKKLQISAKFHITNVGKGIASNVKCDIKLPQNTTFIDGNSHQTFEQIYPAEEKIITIDFLPNADIADSVEVYVNLQEKYNKYAKKIAIPIIFGQTRTLTISQVAENLAYSITNSCKLNSQTSVALVHKDWYKKYVRTVYGKEILDYAVITIKLQGSSNAIRNAKAMIGLDLGKLQMVKDRYTGRDNEIWFLVPVTATWGKMTCGDGCTPITLWDLNEELKGNGVYEMTLDIHAQ